MNDLNLRRKLGAKLAHRRCEHVQCFEDAIHFVHLQAELQAFWVLSLIDDLIYNPQNPFDLFTL